MSARNNNNKKQVSAVKPYCKVCHDAGKSEKEYTSHFVKSAPGPEGKVVCPTLMCQRCGYCSASGHTPKFCPVLAAQKAAEEKALKQAARKEVMEKREAEKAAPKPAPVKAKSSNIFAALDSDSDSEPEPKKVSKKVSQPQIIEPKNVAPIVAKVAAKPVAKLVAKENEFPALSAAPKAAPKTESKHAAKGQPQFLAALNMTCPGLKIGNKMPEVNTYRPPIAQLVRKKPQEAEAEEEYEEPEPSDFTMADFVEAAYQRVPMKASEMDWAMEDSDSDDEDW
jgi:hypothetical protein